MPESGILLRAPRSAGEWDLYFRLRWRLLRAPWGEAPGSERDDLEDAAWHLAAWDHGGAPVGLGRLHRLDATTGQVRYMGVLPAWRGRGIGASLLAGLERIAAEQGLLRVALNARVPALGLYRRAGYLDQGPAELRFATVQHRHMVKVLDPSGRPAPASGDREIQGSD